MSMSSGTRQPFWCSILSPQSLPTTKMTGRLSVYSVAPGMLGQGRQVVQFSYSPTHRRIHLSPTQARQIGAMLHDLCGSWSAKSLR